MSVPPFRPPVPEPLHPNSWTRPRSSSEYRVTQTFAHVNERISRLPHAALDMGNGRLGGVISAPAAGSVIAAGWVREPFSETASAAQRLAWHSPDPSGYGGRMVVIAHVGGDYISGLAHLGSISVTPGQNVTAGQQVGTLGNSGAAFTQGGHCHWDLYRRATGARVDGYLVVSYARSAWRKVDAWPLLAQNWTTPSDTAIQPPQEDDMRFSGADFHVAPNVPTYRLTAASNFRSGAGTSNPSYGVIPAGTSVPVAYLVDGQVINGSPQWALCFLYLAGAYRSGFVHSSLLEPLAQPTSGPSADEVAALVKAGRKAGAQGAAQAATTYAAAQ